MICSSCNSENRDGRRFCGQCGAALTVTCGACGAANEPGERFCGECGNGLVAGSTAPAAPIAERRVISILFADLVGFTPFSEERDPEEVREMLARYFDVATAIVGRYGGTLEKFIGDAVVAVWGTPVALEDDAERAVRAALDLVAAVADLGDEHSGSLELRAAVSTGETAVTIGALGQGMVAGDVVNTTARMQSAANSGSVLIDEATRRATEAAIQSAPAGAFTLKGKTEPVELWAALRVVAARGGEGRSRGLEPPFVGRDREFRLVKEAALATAEGGRAQLVSIVGVAGIGKSRLAWEFEKHTDGLVEDFWWHQGRCLSYGDGVAFWALAEMLRVRARIKEDDSPETTAAKLGETVARFVPDAEEAGWITPSLRHLLGLEELSDGDRGRLFSGWRLFFERMASDAPTVLVFEDIQWADQGLLDFIEYLMEWSRDHPLLVVTLARPELFDRRPGWGVGSRAFTSLALDPFSPETMRELVSGIGPDLPDGLVGRIVERAEGVPLYAVETVRMLLDRGLLERRDGTMVPTTEVESLEIPATLHALAAARLDALGESERRLVQDASVLGKTFQIEGLIAVSGQTGDTLNPILTGLARKEIFTLQADPFSPDQGQYGFVQELLRTVAYETLSRRDRKARHLATAAHLEASPVADELIEVIAAHQLDAYRAVPDESDDVRAAACDTLIRASLRAASLAAPAEAGRLVLQAAELSDSDLEHAQLLLRGAKFALSAGIIDMAEDIAKEAIVLLDSAGDSRGAASAHVVHAEASYLLQRTDEALAEMQAAYTVMGDSEPNAELAMLAAQLGRMYLFVGHSERALEPLNRAIEIAEALDLAPPLSDALNSKALATVDMRPQEARSLLEGALRIALDNDVPHAALRAYFNLSYIAEGWGRSFAEYDAAGIALARRLGERQWERSFAIHVIGRYHDAGDWDRAVAATTELLESAQSHDAFVDMARAHPLACVQARRGDIAAARQSLLDSGASEASPDVQVRGIWAAAAAAVEAADGNFTEGMRLATLARSLTESLGILHHASALGAELYVENALALGDTKAANTMLEWIESLTVGLRTPMLQAIASGTRARLGMGDVDAEFETALAIFRRISRAWELGNMLEAYGRSLESRGLDGSSQIAEARDIYVKLGATPSITKLDSDEGPARATFG